MKTEIEQLKQQAAELLARIERLESQPVKKKSLLSRPDKGEQWNRVFIDTNCGLFADSGVTTDPTALSFVAFAEPYAADYAKALNTFFALRHCEGSEPAKDGAPQAFISSKYANDALCVMHQSRMFEKLERHTAWFNTKSNALAAIETVGEANILHMMKTFSGIFWGGSEK